jgi:hypothetical protein
MGELVGKGGVPPAIHHPAQLTIKKPELRSHFFLLHNARMPSLHNTSEIIAAADLQTFSAKRIKFVKKFTFGNLKETNSGAMEDLVLWRCQFAARHPGRLHNSSTKVLLQGRDRLVEHPAGVTELEHDVCSLQIATGPDRIYHGQFAQQ